MESPGAYLSRLQELTGYEWDTDSPPFHSSYDNWHFFGTKIASDSSIDNHLSVPPSSSTTSYPVRQPSSRTSTDSHVRPSMGSHKHSGSDITGISSSPSDPALEQSSRSIRVVARVSRHVLRIEREYQLCQQIWAKGGKNRKHFVKPIELVRLAPRNGDSGHVLFIVEAPGPNYLKDLVPFGPGAYTGINSDGHWELQAMRLKREEIPLSMFLDFAIGATKCLEILHHENKVVHGEIRGDAFHFNQTTGIVKLINFGSGSRSFENGLTSAGWYSLIKEHGIEHKLCFIAPEQTGRLPAQPDGRTDIYSLGVLLWSMLTGETPFAGNTPLVVMQNVLSRRIPEVSSKRLDVPEALASVIARMTQKNIDNRYNSISGLGYDLRHIRHLLDEGNSEALKAFEIGSKDVSSYFNLPNHQIGRQKEQAEIIQIMEQFCAKINYTDRARQRITSSVPFSQSVSGDVRSEGNSLSADSLIGSASKGSKGSSGLARGNIVGEPGPSNVTHPVESSSSPLDRDNHQAIGIGLKRSTSILEQTDPTIDRSSSNSTVLSGMIDTAALLLRPPTGGKQNNHHCELIAVSGAAGLGKSCMIQSISTAARLRGYYATGKFDQARKAPFEPILKALSSLFRQIFSESDISTEFHHHIRSNVQPIWLVLHTYLDLPIWLLDSEASSRSSDNRTTKTAGMSSAEADKPDNVAASWLKAGSSTKSSRFSNLFLGVLSVICSRRFVCFCIDDLQFADSESLDLLLSMERSKIPFMLVMTNREEDQLSRRAKALIAKAKKIELKPFDEQETAEYVSLTIHRDPEYVFPLTAVIQEKTGGNPFFIREMLSTCYRKECIYYSWTNSVWEFDLDRVFSEFVSSSYGSQMNNGFVMRRLQELPAISQSLLVWSSLIGSTFNFAFVKVLMEGSVTGSLSNVPCAGTGDPVSGLQAALNAYILMPTDDESRFRFSHDRYMQASASLAESYDETEMHFAIAKTLLHPRFRESGWAQQKSVHLKCRYISLGASVIRSREVERQSYRYVLMEGAEIALEAGARGTAINYLTTAIDLLQDDPWNTDNDDVDYQQTLRLYIKAAENQWYQNNFQKAMELIQTVYNHARGKLDLSPCWIIESRIYVRQGNNAEAFKCLKQALSHFNVDVPEATGKDCDDAFWKLHSDLLALDQAQLVKRAQVIEPAMEVIGLLLTELSSAAFWSSSRLFFQISMIMVKIHIQMGAFPQCGLAFLQLGIVAITKYNLTEFGIDLGDLSMSLLNIYHDDNFTLGRGLTLHALFYGHLQSAIGTNFQQLTQAWEASLMTGDRILSLLNIGVSAAFRVWASYDFAEIEMFTTEGHADLLDCDQDLRGGVFIVGVRQYSRAMLGKTDTGIANNVLDDDAHKSDQYEEYLLSKSTPADRQFAVYGSYKLAALYRFGHWNAAIELGERVVDLSEAFFSSRFVYENMLYLCLSYFASIQDDPKQATRQARLDYAKSVLNRFQQASVVNDINFKAWALLVQAQFAAVSGNFHDALVAYETALDHCQGSELTLDKAMILELYAELLLRRGARRPAYQLFHESAAVYRQISAFGKMSDLSKRYPDVFEQERKLGYTDVACQTEEDEVAARSFKLPPVRGTGPTKEERTEAWVHPDATAGGKVLEESRNSSNVDNDDMLTQEYPAIGSLDMIDLASILESSQLLSSELKVDKLMGKMADIITEIASANIVGIVIRDERHEYRVSAIGSPDGVTTFENPISMETDEIPRQLALQVTKYVLRSKETVFVHNLLEDDRFSGASASWMAANPQGASIISVPIIHSSDLLGAIYVEGPPNKFTERNLSVLRLLVNQISISLSNAFVLKKIEKVSAENAAMVGLQRTALTHARTAEGKAKVAQLEAEKNTKLKEEASKAKSMFLANVSHELRTPLTGVLGMSELLKSTDLTAVQADYADSIRICADTLLAVINDLLDFTKLDAGKMVIKEDPLELCRVVSEVVRALKFQNNQKGLKTVTELEIDPNLILIGDAMRMHQILLNLLSNSYKFTARGGVTVRVVPVVEEAEHITITITVKDTGIGVPEEQLTKLFKPFSQVESKSSRAFQGTGLGLSICKALVEKMGGKIWLESEPGQGTTVGFTIRYAKATEKDLAALAEAQKQFQQQYQPASPGSISTNKPSTLSPNATPESQSPSPVEDGKVVGTPYHADISTVSRDQIRVCLCEDNAINTKIAMSYVQRLGFTCDAYLNGRLGVTALEKAAAAGKPYHIVLMDVQMPVLDGYDATREIRRHVDPAVRDVLVIAMTASAIQGDREKCLEAGMNDYLAKPVRPQTLNALLETYLDPLRKARGSKDSPEPLKGERSMKSASDSSIAASEKDS